MLSFLNEMDIAALPLQHLILKIYFPNFTLIKSDTYQASCPLIMDQQ